jgi:hypothetical protein
MVYLKKLIMFQIIYQLFQLEDFKIKVYLIKINLILNLLLSLISIIFHLLKTEILELFYIIKMHLCFQKFITFAIKNLK